MKSKLFLLFIAFFILLLCIGAHGQTLIDYDASHHPGGGHHHIHYKIENASDGLGAGHTKGTDTFRIGVMGIADKIQKVKIKIKDNGDGEDNNFLIDDVFSYDGFTVTLEKISVLMGLTTFTVTVSSDGTSNSYLEKIEFHDFKMGDTKYNITSPANGETIIPRKTVEIGSTTTGMVTISPDKGAWVDSKDHDSEHCTSPVECNYKFHVREKSGKTRPCKLDMQYIKTFSDNHSQGDKLKYFSPETPDKTLDVENVYIYAKSKQGDIWFSGPVSNGGQFTIDASYAAEPKTQLDTETLVEIWTSDKQTLLQGINFHTSCSAPIVEGDEYGYIKLVNFYASCDGDDSPVNTVETRKSYVHFPLVLESGVESYMLLSMKLCIDIAFHHPVTVGVYQSSWNGECITWDTRPNSDLDYLLPDGEMDVTSSGEVCLDILEFYNLNHVSLNGKLSLVFQIPINDIKTETATICGDKEEKHADFICPRIIYEYDTSLPVELSSFDVSVDKGSVELSWETASEIRNLGFIIDKKSDLEDWTTIASFETDNTLEGNGSTSEANYYSYTDNKVVIGQTYQYRLSDVDFDGKVTVHDNYVQEILVPIKDGGVPNNYSLSEIYPNPFNPTANIQFQVPERSNVKIIVYDLSGNFIDEVFNGEKNVGTYTFRWDASSFPSGVYFIQMEAGTFSTGRTCILMK